MNLERFTDVAGHLDHPDRLGIVADLARAVADHLGDLADSLGADDPRHLEVLAVARWWGRRGDAAERLAGLAEARIEGRR
jgi:hypothetical protein